LANNNEKFWKTLRIILVIMGLTVSTIVLIIGASKAYGILTEKVGNNSEKITANWEEIEKVNFKANSNQIAIVEMKTDITYIKKGIDDIKEELKK